MTELLKTQNANGTRTKICFKVYNKNDNIVVELLKFDYSDNNKWKKPNVLTDLLVIKHILPSGYIQIDPNGEKIKDFITKNYKKNVNVFEQIEEMAKQTTRIVFALPTSFWVLNNPRKIKDTYFPLIVFINDRNVSGAFMDFGDYGHDIIEVASKALLQGQMPEFKNDIFYLDEVEKLHKELQ